MTIDLYIARDNSRRRTNLDGQTNRRTKAGEHIDERIGTEEVNTPAKEIADSGLSHAQSLGGSLLFEPASRDKLLHLDHEIRPDQKMLGFLATESHITEDISAGRCNLRFHIVHSP